jgi:hypothetical protein
MPDQGLGLPGQFGEDLLSYILSAVRVAVDQSERGGIN